MSKSLGERLAHALAVTQDQDVGDCPPDVMEIFEKAAPIFVASLSHDETATATIEGLRGEVKRLREQLMADEQELTGLIEWALEERAPLRVQEIASIRRRRSSIRAALNSQEDRNVD